MNYMADLLIKFVPSLTLILVAIVILAVGIGMGLAIHVAGYTIVGWLVGITIILIAAAVWFLPMCWYVFKRYDDELFDGRM
jgi:uncharacterized membrane protein